VDDEAVGEVGIGDIFMVAPSRVASDIFVTGDVQGDTLAARVLLWSDAADVTCPADAMECPAGSATLTGKKYATRVPHDRCAFEPCVDGRGTRPDGSVGGDDDDDDDDGDVDVGFVALVVAAVVLIILGAMCMCAWFCAAMESPSPAGPTPQSRPGGSRPPRTSHRSASQRHRRRPSTRSRLPVSTALLATSLLVLFSAAAIAQSSLDCDRVVFLYAPSSLSVSIDGPSTTALPSSTADTGYPTTTATETTTTTTTTMTMTTTSSLAPTASPTVSA
jgi:hypothetical protein